MSMRNLIAIAILLSTTALLTGWASDNAITLPEVESIPATGLLCQKQVDTAISALEASIASDSKDTRAHHNLGCAYALKLQYDKAVSEFEIARQLETTSFNAVIAYNEAIVYLAAGKFQEGARLLGEALLIDPGLAKHENVASIKSYCDAAGSDPAYILGYNASSLEMPDTALYAQKIQKLGQEDVYAFELSKALPLFFYHSRAAFVFMGTGYFFQKQYAQAKEQFLNALATKDTCAAFDQRTIFLVHYYLGSLEAVSGDHRAAVTHFEEAQEIDPENIANLRDLAWAYFLNRDYLKARDTCDRALELHPEPRDEKPIKELFDTINKEYIR